MQNGCSKSCHLGLAAWAALSLVHCSGVNPANLFGPGPTETATDGGMDRIEGALATDAGDRGTDVIVMSATPEAAAEPEAGTKQGTMGATVEADATPASFDDSGALGDSNDGGGVGSPPADTGPADGTVVPDATDVCLNPPAGRNAIAAATFEAPADPGLGWTGFGGCAFETTSAFAHCGSRSGRCVKRTAAFQGPGYDLPLNAATYSVSAWVFQDGATATSLLWNGKLVCAANGGATTIEYPPISLPVSVPPRTWVLTTGIFVVPTGCMTAQLYLNQLGIPLSLPNLYADDVYVF